jgi:hypothetical protein
MSLKSGTTPRSLFFSRTPFEKLTALPNWEKHLKPSVTAAALDRLAHQLSDTEAGRKLLCVGCRQTLTQTIGR